MKLKLIDLVADNYYLCQRNFYDTKFYFKFKGYDEYVVNYYGFQIEEKEYSKLYQQYDDGVFCDIDYYNGCILFEKVDIQNIIEYLPPNNIDKINYLRKSKINYLLNNA